ncbi:UDP-N-acetylmuramoyl-L-alanyl-D-glutamate:meso-diaminopimelate ligase [Georgfuchsia toluolica]|uniref:UDP-N-acetylmuramoyl-L-alanyl-D-glutamate--2,6-diaminopimelate ligase n=1 Tax=Georgfuchsia toluolica TaxID=424218 RepID=A0A916N2N3_9PROT|nr:UDP-N-acetylmuramoyl-L-alanyl-D-glutamate--2,6-diaminopimelate ligase [Georgfuchsia toluolica]CAG4884109.1 UDP-N-acetylmuramoyl-L-alanyl-D-glutamate:meso-diaminopimelate ligase [Georgfuchsia toluolica]
MNAVTVIEALQRQGVNTSRLCLDSRRIQHGDIFVACHGASRDGRDYINDAVHRGAAAVLYDAEPSKAIEPGVPSLAVEGLAKLLGEIAHLVYGRPSEKLQVIGVTGTNGKTSVSQWIAQALGSLGQRCAVMGTLGNGFPGRLEESPNTTPDAIAVHSGLASYLAQGATACAMEVSSIGLDQGRVNGVIFDTAVFTNLTRDHLDYHADMDVYAAAKARLFAMPGLKTAVLNLDDPCGVQLAASLRGRVRTLGYSLNPQQARVTDKLLLADDIHMPATGVEFSVNGMPVAAPVIGRFNVSNLLAVFGSLQALGIDAAQAGAALATVTPPPGRLQAIGGKGQPLVVVDYAHTPDALDKALTTLREIASARHGRLICLFGCGGERDPGKRPLMGAMAERLADGVVVTSDNPRGEAPAHIAAQIATGMQTKPLVELDRAVAIRKAIVAADACDVILLAGKGHETYQEIAGVRQPFSDLGSAQRALEQRP